MTFNENKETAAKRTGGGGGCELRIALRPIPREHWANLRAGMFTDCIGYAENGCRYEDRGIASCAPEIFPRGFFHPFIADIARTAPFRRGILVLISQELLTYDGIEQLAGHGL